MAQVPYTSWGCSGGRGPQAIELIRGRSCWATGLKPEGTLLYYYQHIKPALNNCKLQSTINNKCNVI